MVVLLNKYEGMGASEIADLMDLSITATKSLLHRAREKIKEKLTPYIQQGLSKKETGKNELFQN